jgi:osmoprotectant transport system permease protein
VNGLIVFLQERGGTIGECMFQHVRLTVVAMLLAILVAVPAGLGLTRTPRLARISMGLMSIIQTMPSLALVGLMVPIIGAGPRAAILALFLYALLPICRNTYTGIRSVDPASIETAKAMGMTSAQILLRVELPLSVPTILAGIRTSTVICVGIATLGGIIGAGGLGHLIWIGIDRANDSLIYAGAVPAMALALCLDGLLALSERALSPPGTGTETES